MRSIHGMEIINISKAKLFVAILVMEPSNIFGVLIVSKEITLLIVAISGAIGFNVLDVRKYFNNNNISKDTDYDLTVSALRKKSISLIKSNKGS